MKRIGWYHVGALLVGLAMATVPAPAQQGARTSAWREAYQSSPGSYPPGVLRWAAEKLKWTPQQVVGMLSTSRVTGTLRYRVKVSAAGSQIRIRFTNEENPAPLNIAAASVAEAADGIAAKPGTMRPLTFGGDRAAVAVPGAPTVSDPIALPVHAGSELVISLYFAEPVELDARADMEVPVDPGDQTQSPPLAGSKLYLARPLVSGVEVLSRPDLGVIVALGDSITDGHMPNTGRLHGWPDELSKRLSARRGVRPFAVVNSGISGNRLLVPGAGQAALARLDRDVLRLDGLAYVIVLIGTNDIGTSDPKSKTRPGTTAELLKAGYRQLVLRIHARGAKVALATIPPFRGAPTHFSEEKNRLREEINAWIRTSGVADAVIDFDRILRDPANPLQLRAEYDSGDHLHPSEAGARAMGDAIDLTLFH